MFLIQLSKPDKPTVPQVYAMTLAANYNTVSFLKLTPSELYATLKRHIMDMNGIELLTNNTLTLLDHELEIRITSIHNDSTLTIKYI